MHAAPGSANVACCWLMSLASTAAGHCAWLCVLGARLLLAFGSACMQEMGVSLCRNPCTCTPRLLCPFAITV